MISKFIREQCEMQDFENMEDYKPISDEAGWHQQASRSKGDL
jgi:hypothetical protein